MNEIIKKIDELLNSEYSHGDIHTSLVRDGLLIARNLILSSQKEPCKYCENEILTVKMEFGYDSYMGKDGWVSSTRHPKVYPMCGRQLNQKAEEE